ncbi:MAG: DOMON-like domain-containing protein [Rhizomicrobium sp.]
MRQALKIHPDSRCTAATHIEADVTRPRPGHLVLHYFVTGRMSDLCLPPVTAPARTDELWRHTCFEAFVRAPPGAAYYEFNFAPSLQWAAYRFDGYRSRMRIAREVSAPRTEVQSNDTYTELQVLLELDCLPIDAAWRLGLSAVIQETSGRKSYWALAHPPGAADFHHSDCFVLELPAASQP